MSIIAKLTSGAGDLGRKFRKSLIGACAFVLAGCAATGGPFGLTEEQGRALGDQEHPKIVAAFGGELDDPELKAYVQRIHDRLIAASSQPDADIQITLLDSPVVNAMALPGHTYVTRGLLALANSEAELAGVMGHEIGHIYGRHTAKRVSRGNLAQIGAAAAAILTGDQDTAQLAGQAAQLYLLRFSRQQEYEAEQYGVRMLAAAGYDPLGEAEFLNTLGRWSNLEMQIAGAQRPPEFLSTHPNTAERVRRAAEEAQVLGQNTSGKQKSRRDYLRQIDGVIYGDDPVKQGFIRGRDFIHPTIGIAFTVPQGFQLQNSSQAVLARSQTGAQMQFTGGSSQETPTAIINGPLSQNLQVDLSPAVAINVNGRQGAVGQARANTQSGQVDVTAYVIRWEGTTNYIFLWVTPANQTRQLQNPIARSVESLRIIDPRTANTPPARQIDVVTVQQGDTVSGLANRTLFPNHKQERFIIMNGLSSDGALRAGDEVKLVR